MMRFIKISLISVFIAFGFIALAAPADALSPKDTVCQSIGSSSSGGGCSENANRGSSVWSALNTVVDVLSIIVGIISVIFIIIAGFKYITANGDSSKIASAKSTLIYTLVGLFIVGIAQILVNFVATKAANF